MKFTEHRDSNVLVVKHYEPGLVKINDRQLQNSCFLNQKQLVEHWPCDHIGQLDSQRLDALFALNPEVIILGTGEQQVFPEPKLFAYCAQKGIGLEVMNNSAACRTYNVLTTEDREVVLALIMDV
ncbi:Mth938-like domain-containing protein [Thiomicrorhabdus sp. zzn3]|uniref:Mth938-like domain-containing protein n=1 Tax=Thiomicrorhabdus sp. zzn3 TaxID=3039775 RepID=UPI00243698A5|nr:Mth938-like domain-containing protein [Thiomicrorhabdus sp. zzn3]MDG6778010.1 Mth938-like domain-containing protein [Thiomicrorhabdus sp. zzn3]